MNTNRALKKQAIMNTTALIGHGLKVSDIQASVLAMTDVEIANRELYGLIVELIEDGTMRFAERSDFYGLYHVLEFTDEEKPD